jgi:hypothetical protein
MEVSTGSDEKQSTERKMTPDKGGDVYLVLTSTQLDQDVWLEKCSWGMTRQPKLSDEEEFD